MAVIAVNVNHIQTFLERVFVSLSSCFAARVLYYLPGLLLFLPGGYGFGDGMVMVHGIFKHLKPL